MQWDVEVRVALGIALGLMGIGSGLTGIESGPTVVESAIRLATIGQGSPYKHGL